MDCLGLAMLGQSKFGFEMKQYMASGNSSTPQRHQARQCIIQVSARQMVMVSMMVKVKQDMGLSGPHEIPDVGPAPFSKRNLTVSREPRLHAGCSAVQNHK